jgi:hypothetical protein
VITASLSFEEATIPPELKALPQWVNWKAIPNDERVEKIPVCALTGSNASSTDPDTWTNYRTAAMNAMTAESLGLGFVFSKTAGIVGIDLDKCRDPDTGALEPWAEEIVKDLDSYTEISPSGRGLHIYVVGELPPGRMRKGRIEAYQHGRFFTVTGQQFEGTPATVEERSTKLVDFHARYLAEPIQPARQTNTTPESALYLSDEAIVAKCQAAKNAAKFEALWRGDWGGYLSQSDADLALLGQLKFYTQDGGQLDRLFRRSGLMRAKWDERRGQQTYGERTTQEALKHVSETYTPCANARTISTSTLPEQVWPSVIPLDDVTLPGFPIEAFPDPLGRMCQAVANATETPIELAAMMGLATVATCTQRVFEIAADVSYREPLNLWTVSALESGNRKTAVYVAMTEALRTKERDLCEQAKNSIAKAESERETIETRIKVLRGRLANSADSADIAVGQVEIDELRATMPDVPASPRLWAQDITPEKLGALMADNRERLALLSDEGGLFDILAGRYSNGVPNLDTFLQAHAGAPVRVDRGSRPPVVMYRPALTIGLSPQPGVLRGLTAKAGFRDRGLLARFLYTLPASRLGYRSLKTAPVSEVVREAYHNMAFALLTFEPSRDADGDTVPFIVQLSPEARKEWWEFAESVECNLRPQGLYEHIKDWAGKLPGAALRVAGNFHCVEHAKRQPWASELSLETMRGAVTVLTVLSTHALAVFGLMGADPAIEAARKLWQWVEQNRRTSFTGRDCFNAVRGTYPKMAELEPGFGVLIERGYVMPHEEQRSGPGRPSRAYSVNPSLTEEWT